MRYDKIARALLIHSIQTRNFRNLETFRLEFSDRANFISGRNGQGKTNLIEAIYWLLALRGKRGSSADAIRRDESSFDIEAEITFGELRHNVKLHVEGRSRKLLIDGSPPKRKRDYMEQVLAVDFFPEDLLILLMEPALRRRFLDIACARFDLTHEDVLLRFKRLLEQRNSLLKREIPPAADVLDSFDEPLADAAAKVASARLLLLSKLGVRTDDIFREGIGEKYEAVLEYQPHSKGIPKSLRVGENPDTEHYRGIYLDLLKSNRRRHLEARRTIDGPHRDDFSMTLDGKSVRTYASRGEIRSAMFALHLARFHVLTEKRGIQPIVLIDDVMSELDSARRRRVLELLPSGQVFLTSCDPPADLQEYLNVDFRHFEIDRGSARLIT